MAILKLTLLFAVIFVARGENAKGSEFYKRFLTKQAPPPPAGGAKGKESFVFQSPHGFAHGHGNGFGGYPGYGFGGFGPWGHGHGFGNLGHIHPVPVTGVKALSVAYDPVSGVPYVCDPNKKAGAAGGAGAAKAPATGKRSEIESDEKKNEDEKDDDKKDEKDEDKKNDEEKKTENDDEKNIENDDEKKIEKGEEKKDEIKVKIPDYPPCPDPKKSFPWSCILGDKSSKREECARAKKAVDDASKRYWPAAGGFYPPYFGGYRGLGYGGLGLYGGLGPYGGLGLYGGLAPYGVPVVGFGR